MVEVGSEVTVGAPGPAVWDLLVRPARIPEWNEVHAGFAGPVPETLGPGAGYRQQVKMLGLAMTLSWQVVEVDPGRLLVLAGEGPAGMTITTRYALSGATGGTRVSLRSSFDGGPAATPFAPAVQRYGQKQADRSAAALAELLG